MRSAGLLIALLSMLLAATAAPATAWGSHGHHHATVTIEAPADGARLSALPVDVKVRFERPIKTGSFVAKLNHRRVTGAFEVSSTGAVAALSEQHGVRVGSGKGAWNRLCVKVRSRHKPWGQQLDCAWFFVKPMPPAASGIRVTAVLADEAGIGSDPLGAGVLVRIGGEKVGVTDATGSLVIERPPGSYQVEALLPSMAAGSTTADVVAGRITDVTVTLIEGDGAIQPAQLTLEELVNGALPADAPAVTLRFRSDPGGTPVPITTLSRVELYSRDPSPAFADLTEHFHVSSGTITATGADAAAVIEQMAGFPGAVRMLVHGGDADGFSYEAELVFTIGTYTIEGQLAAPPSKPDLALGGVSVVARADAGSTSETISDAQGRFTFTVQPGGMIKVSASTADAGIAYLSSAHIALDNDKRLVLRLLAPADVAAGTPEYELSDLPGAMPLSRLGTPALARSLGALRQSGQARVIAAAEADTATVNVTGAAEQQEVAASDTLTVAQDTQTVILEYEIATAEYPTYVLQQSKYNDTWNLTVRSSAGQLFELGRAVNSQLYSPPTWNGSGSTGSLQAKLDVSALTQTGDAELTLSARTKNVGDDILPTSVSATLGGDERFVVNNVEPDNPGPTNDNKLFSIPRPGDTNTLQRDVIVTYDKPEEIDLTHVKIELLDQSAGPLQTVLDEDADGVHIKPLGENRLAAQVTFSAGTTSSSVASTPPPVDRVGYRVTLTGTDEDGDPVEPEPKDLTGLLALWRMPDGVPRYSVRSDGGDDWSRKLTYEWIDSHRPAITPINDISKEHGGRFKPHDSHRLGYDIDMFHPYPLTAGSGTQNYLALDAAARQAIQGDPQALGRLSAWVTNTRAWLDTMIADPDVIKIGYAYGAQDLFSAAVSLRGGWAQELLFTGQYIGPAPQNNVIQLGLGSWAGRTSPKLFFDDEHNNHVHIRLRPG